jgi:hypothetical protein
MERKRLFTALGLAVLAAAVAPPTWARSLADMPYPLARIWGTAVRFIRVDRSYSIREKDEPSGYILFDVIERDKVHQGSLELVSTLDHKGRTATRAILSLPQLPHHYEVMLLDKLAAKIKEEQGPPAEPVQKPPGKPPAPDAGALPQAPHSALPQVQL